jgi:mono/diheme cytochrome c family protein
LRIAPAGGAILILAGLTFTGAEAACAYQRSLPNPVPADAASLARVQQVYQTAGCAPCHGDTGRGVGRAGRVLRPRPADFRAISRTARFSARSLAS